jgi:hypothetical protein
LILSKKLQAVSEIDSFQKVAGRFRSSTAQGKPNIDSSEKKLQTI